METRVITAPIPASLAERVDLCAERSECPRVWVIKQALETWLEQNEKRHLLTLEALADVDVGAVINHQAVVSLAKSLGTDKPFDKPKL